MTTFTTADGVELRYEERGPQDAAAPPVYVLQGGPNNICDTLVEELRPLEDHVRLVFHDYRGSGRSAAAPPQTYRFERFADDLDELRRHLGHERISVLAHSMGGFVALQAALRHGAVVDRLALVGTTPCGAAGPMALPTLRALGPWRLVKVALMGLRFLALWSWRRPSPERTMAMYAPMSVTQEARRELRPVVAAAHRDLPVDNDNSAVLMETLGTVDLRSRLGEIACPTLVLYGSRDAVMVAGGRLLRKGLPHAEVVVLDGVGHEPFLEAPADTFAALRRFLAVTGG